MRIKKILLVLSLILLLNSFSACSEKSRLGLEVQKVDLYPSEEIGLIRPTPSKQPISTKTPLSTSTEGPFVLATIESTPDIAFVETSEGASTSEQQEAAEWKWHEAGEPVVAPILLYHHITSEDINNNYYLSVALFEQHMDWVRSEGYTPITISLLAEAIVSGAFLPERPLLITFDDGYDDLYQFAYPVLEARGFVATAYLIGVCLNADGCITTDQVKILADKGWEFGSHSMTHQYLTTVTDLNYEMYQSRVVLEDELGIEINTFAYPYGAGDAFIFRKSWQYGYAAAMGLGNHITHSSGTLFYLSRLVIHNGVTVLDLEQMVEQARKNDGF